MTCSASKSMVRRICLTIPLFLFIAGCGPSQEEMMAKDSLEQARVVYRQAKANPNVTGTAQVPLIDAEKELQAAEKTTDYKEMALLAYMAKKKSQTAIVMAEGKVADRELEQLQKESNAAILKKKEHEIKSKEQEVKNKEREIQNKERESAEKGRELEIANIEIEKAKTEAEQAKAQNAQLMKELSELNGKLTDRGIVLTLGDVLFSFGKADLSPAANVSIAKLAQFLVNHPDRTLSIEGHTDSVGSDSYNDALSQRRAESVKMALVARGVGAERITTKGLGKRFPVASNSTAQGRQLNRRVEVVVLNQGVKPESQ
jgi:outer membrane protein OmpA-like peptidoglycan-associated protein